MENQPQSREELETKVEKYKKRVKVSLRTMILGGFFMISSVVGAYSFFDRSSPPMFKDYINAQTTLNILENKREDLPEIVELPYKTKETTSVQDMFYKDREEQTPIIDKAITSVEKDISKMKEYPELKQYFTNEKNASKYFYSGFFGGMLLLIGGGITNVKSQFKRDTCEEKLKKN